MVFVFEGGRPADAHTVKEKVRFRFLAVYGALLEKAIGNLQVEARQADAQSRPPFCLGFREDGTELDLQGTRIRGQILAPSDRVPREPATTALLN